MRFEEVMKFSELLLTNMYETDKIVSPLQKEDSDKIGEMLYFPPNGTFNLMYYPYYGKKAQVRLADY